MSVFVQHFKKMGRLDNLHFTVCNVGSRKVGNQDEDYGDNWAIFAPNLSIYGFDADEDSCREDNQELAEREINWQEKHIPVALSDSIGESTLYVTKEPFCSSLYPPNEPYLKRFQGLPELVNLDFSIEIETTTLEAFCSQENINEIDFLQIDVQGADLKVLQGANSLLNNVLAIQIEVEFSPLYLNQPLFADVDSFLRNHNFTLFDLYSSYCKRYSLNIQSPFHPQGQLLWGDAFYLRDLISEDFPKKDQQNPERIFKLACVADMMGFYDYAVEILVYLTRNFGEDKQYDFTDFIGFAL